MLNWYDPEFYAFSPLSGVTITDTDPDAMDTATITGTFYGFTDDPGGTLSGTNLTRTSSGVYKLAAGTPQTLTDEVDALLYTPFDSYGGTQGFTIPFGITIVVSDNGVSSGSVSTTINVILEDPQVSVDGVAGIAGLAGRLNGRGGIGESAEAYSESFASPAYVGPGEDSDAIAQGGNGGAGANATGSQTHAGAGGAGGAATATAIMVSDVSDANFDNAIAYGGQGGAGGQGGGNGGTGGAATAFANASYGNISDDGSFPNAMAFATGGTGGTAFGIGATGGAGGAASGSLAIAESQSSAWAFVSEAGGAGGDGVQGANGGSGAACAIVNAVIITSSAGDGALLQYATGGQGGSSDTGKGGNGGTAISDFTADYADNPAIGGNDIFADVEGYGGSGGAGAVDGNGGGTWDVATLTGAGSVGAYTTAVGGGGQVGGDAEAKATAIGQNVDAEADATGGSGLTIAGIANAIATGTGASGSVEANTSTGLFGPGNLVTEVDGSAEDGLVDGTSTALSQAGIGTTEPSNPGSAIAYIDALPVAAYASRAEAGAPATIAAMGTTPTIIAMGELGGAHSTLGTYSQTSSTSVSITMDLLQLTSTPDLFLGFYGVGATGSGVTDIEVTVNAGNTNLLSEDFTSTAAAKSWFSDHPIDLGSLGSGPLAASTSLDLSIGMSVTTDQPGSGFSTYLVLGHG